MKPTNTPTESCKAVQNDPTRHLPSRHGCMRIANTALPYRRHRKGALVGVTVRCWSDNCLAAAVVGCGCLFGLEVEES